MIGDFPNPGPVRYNKDSISNILSLADVSIDMSLSTSILQERPM